MQQKLGKWSLRFAEAPFILESSSVVGTKEADGPLGGLFDIVGKDDRFGQNTWEKAESSNIYTMKINPARGEILDVNGVELAINMTGYNVIFKKIYLHPRLFLFAFHRRKYHRGGNYHCNSNYGNYYRGLSAPDIG